MLVVGDDGNLKTAGNKYAPMTISNNIMGGTMKKFYAQRNMTKEQKLFEYAWNLQQHMSIYIPIEYVTCAAICRGTVQSN